MPLAIKSMGKADFALSFPETPDIGLLSGPLWRAFSCWAAYWLSHLDVTCMHRRVARNEIRSLRREVENSCPPTVLVIYGNSTSYNQLTQL